MKTTLLTVLFFAIALVGRAEPPRIQALLFPTEYCPPCERLKAMVKTQFVPSGWKVGSEADADIRIMGDTLLPRRGKYPTIIIIDNATGKHLAQKSGDWGDVPEATRAAALAEWINSYRVANPR